MVPQHETEHEQSIKRAQFYDRVRLLRNAAPSRTVSEFIWLHQALFVGLDPNAGQIRTAPAAWREAYFARPEFIGASLDDRFADILGADGFSGLTRERFIECLAHHISELHAIAPFAVGNRRIIGLHAQQLAHAAGHQINLYDSDMPRWNAALYRAFVHVDTVEIIAALSGIAPENDAGDATRLGPGGIALLPSRMPPRARRYLKTVKVAVQELDAQLPAACDQAAAELRMLQANAGPDEDLDSAQAILGCLRHPCGPKFMAGLLATIGVKKIEGVFNDTQPALERVHEITAAMIMAIHAQPSDLIENASLNLQSVHFESGHSPHQDRLAAQFLHNSGTTNRLDPRFAAAQRLVDGVSADVSAMVSRDVTEIERLIDQTRDIAAALIRSGDMGMSGYAKDKGAPDPSDESESLAGA
jgi:cell filamentation protein